MPRPVTLFTGQWADLTIDEVARKASQWGFDGLELACWNQQFDVPRALTDPGYVKSVWNTLRRYNLQCVAISNHLVGQAVSDFAIDARHQSILPPDIWGDGEPGGVRKRAAQRMIDTARAAAKLGVPVVNGFTGSPIWHMVYSFPPNPPDFLEKGLALFAALWT
ncbi:MAG: sugar phosphate isomerase/epimerase, partial [Anaerolineae bacterium]|nr:sugar phosphate isomerase/epimerase [Anaerolineae bacterium]